MSVLLAYSGGLDSTVLLWELRRRGLQVDCLYVQYGHMAAPAEMKAARLLAEKADAAFHILHASNLQFLFAPSEFERGVSLMPFTGQRLALLALAAAFARSRHADAVAMGWRQDQCHPDFHTAASRILEIEHGGRLSLYLPFVERAKDYIVNQGCKIDAPLRRSWSCLEGGAVHCGRCRSCTQRAWAFVNANRLDDTAYIHDEQLPKPRLRIHQEPDPDWAA
jgi:7-cyano-7-deazaguanine synthase